MSESEFWGSAAPRTRVALITAVLTGLVHVGSYFGLTTNGAGQLLFVFQFVVMALMFVEFVQDRAKTWQVLEGKGPKSEFRAVPRWLILATIGSVVNMIAVFLSGANQGEGYPRRIDDGYAWFDGDTLVRSLSQREYMQYFARELRVFSGGWLLFSLMTCAMSYRRLPVSSDEPTLPAISDVPRARPAASSVEAVEPLPGTGGFFGLPAAAIAALAVVLFVGPAIGDGLSERGRALAHMLGAAAFLTLSVRAAYLFERRIFGRTLALLSAILVVAGSIGVMLEWYSDVEGASWVRLVAGGARVVMWTAFASVALFSGFIVLRELRRVSRRW